VSRNDGFGIRRTFFQAEGSVGEAARVVHLVVRVVYGMADALRHPTTETVHRVDEGIFSHMIFLNDGQRRSTCFRQFLLPPPSSKSRNRRTTSIHRETLQDVLVTAPRVAHPHRSSLQHRKDQLLAAVLPSRTRVRTNIQASYPSLALFVPPVRLPIGRRQSCSPSVVWNAVPGLHVIQMRLHECIVSLVAVLLGSA
jgi:hypothetical protein